MLLLLGFAAFFFIGISAILARALSATGAERAKALDFLSEQTRRIEPHTGLPGRDAAESPALVDFCHALLNSNEFVYLD